MGRNTVFFFRELWKNLTRNPLMTAAAASTSIISLLTLGVSLSLIYTINNIIVEISSQVEIHAFLKPATTNIEVQHMQEEILKLPQVRRVEYISPDRALDKLQEDLNLDLDMSANENPLPPALKVKVGDPRQIGVVADQVKNMPEVNDIIYGESILQGILGISRVVKMIGYFLTMLMALGALFTIINTIRLTLIARQGEIRTMKLVGATEWFIRWPFLLEGIAFGLIGAIIATLFVATGYSIVSLRIQSALPFVFPMVGGLELGRRLLFILLLTGVVMGVAGSYISLKHFLEESIAD